MEKIGQHLAKLKVMGKSRMSYFLTHGYRLSVVSGKNAAICVSHKRTVSDCLLLNYAQTKGRKQTSDAYIESGSLAMVYKNEKNRNSNLTHPIGRNAPAIWPARTFDSNVGVRLPAA